MKTVVSISALVAAAFLAAGCGQNSNPQKQTAKPATNSASSNPSDYLGTLVQAKKTADKTIDVAYLNEAVNQFNVQEGRYPKTLAELTPNYVAKIPDAPIGSKLVYDAVKGEVKVVPQ